MPGKKTLTLHQLAHFVLLGDTLEEKLIDAELINEELEPAKHPSLIEVPDFPGRPKKLLRIGNSKFPSPGSFHQATARGHVLHFFANHELLAMELMALVLLRFPEAPAAFRMGLARTLQEEQSHMRLYLDRMRELGVDFGDLPLTDYFWNCLKSMRSPLEFVTQMSLTFEQANLDFSLHYRDEIAKHGDEKTAAILDRVYAEEIGHVKHGLTWFNRWRGNPATESDWAAYKRLLPPPLTPRRAKGTLFCAETRRKIGFSETFIRELEINSGSKGRPPVLWIYNPSCDAEIARGKPGFTPPKAVLRLSQDLEPLLMLLACDTDLVWAKRRPRVEWLKKMSEDGFKIPEFTDSAEIREPKLSGFEPWGWSPEAFEQFRPLRERLTATKQGRGAWNKALLSQDSFAATGIAGFSSKSWSSAFLGRWLASHPESHAIFGGPEIAGVTAKNMDQAHALIQSWLARGHAVVLKAPLGTSGNQVKRVKSPESLSGTLVGWIRNTIEAQGGVVIEPWLEKQHDLSMQMEVHSSVTLLEAREFLTDPLWQYRGTILGKNFWNLPADARRFLNHALPLWQRFAKELGQSLIEGGYQGPAGIDALIWKAPDGTLRLKPLIELNPRWTMGRVALALENHIVPGARAAWVILKKDSIDIEKTEKEHPAEFISGKNGTRLKNGLYWTTDPSMANEAVTALLVGDEALRLMFHNHIRP